MWGFASNFLEIYTVLGYTQNMEKPRILFISRAYPPVIGGIENHNFELGKWLSGSTEIKIIANTRGRKFLPFFAPVAIIKTLFLMPRYDVILLGDGILAFLAWTVKLFSKKPIICVIHGLDINYNSSSLGVWYEKLLIKIYQKLWIGIFIKKIDRFIAVGNETVRVATEHGIPEEKVVFIPNGVDTEKYLTGSKRADIEKVIGKPVENKKIILTSGRLAKRKGAAWFVSNVLPKLGEEYLYVIAGDGPDRKNVEEAIRKNDMTSKAMLLGRVSDHERNVLFNTADLFVQPNIKIPGDMEGFGISVIEACSCRLPVLAANIEGLKDAIRNGRNGFLVESGNPDAFVGKINEIFAKGNPREIFGEDVRKFVVENYSWKNIAERYLREIEKCAIGPSTPAPISSEEIARHT